MKLQKSCLKFLIITGYSKKAATNTKYQLLVQFWPNFII